MSVIAWKVVALTELKKKRLALAGVAQLVRASSHNQKVAGLIFSWGTYLGCGFDPWSMHVWSPVWTHLGGNQCFSLTLMFLSLPLSLPFSLRSNEKMSSGEDQKKTWRKMHRPVPPMTFTKCISHRDVITAKKLKQKSPKCYRILSVWLLKSKIAES